MPAVFVIEKFFLIAYVIKIFFYFILRFAKLTEFFPQAPVSDLNLNYFFKFVYLLKKKKNLLVLSRKFHYSVASKE